jgi:pimeloyl-ACP methyl ester carboxylesterase
MPALSKNYTVIASDLRGLGDSSKPLTGYDDKTVAEDIHQLVAKLGFKTIFLVGHDIGGQIAYSYAAAHPTEVKRLVVSDLAFPGFVFELALFIREAILHLWVISFCLGSHSDGCNSVRSPPIE